MLLLAKQRFLLQTQLVIQSFTLFALLLGNFKLSSLCLHNLFNSKPFLLCTLKLLFLYALLPLTLEVVSQDRQR